MKKEEAIEQLKWYFERDDGTASDSVTKEAYELAIDALKQPEIVRCEDCKFKEGSCCTYSAVYLWADGFCHRGRKRNDTRRHS